MRLLVGLGNPGGAYARNRHNIGFMAVDEIVRRHSFSPWRAKFQGQAAEGVIEGEKVLALKPGTFMNLSGQAVGAASHFHKIALSEVIVLHDELDLPPSKVRVKKGGGAGGHNGLKSIDAHLGNGYWRVRLGIGHPGDKSLVTPYVLGDFGKSDEAWLTPLFDALSDFLPLLFKGDETSFMTKVAAAVPGVKPKKPDPTGGP